MLWILATLNSKRLSLFLQIWTRKYGYIYMKSYLHLIWRNPSMTKYASEWTGDQNFNF
jgi:hypothetical protein